jgi:hypothetical protein
MDFGWKNYLCRQINFPVREWTRIASSQFLLCKIEAAYMFRFSARDGLIFFLFDKIKIADFCFFCH